MEIIQLPARGGKTVKLIQLSSKTGYPIICTNENQKQNIIRTAKQLKIDIPDPTNLDKSPLFSSNHTPVLVDNADQLLERLIGRPVMAATITGDSWEMDGITGSADSVNKLISNDREEFKKTYYGVWEDMP